MGLAREKAEGALTSPSEVPEYHGNKLSIWLPKTGTEHVSLHDPDDVRSNTSLSTHVKDLVPSSLRYTTINFLEKAKEHQNMSTVDGQDPVSRKSVH